jgi:hypothetical protein
VFLEGRTLVEHLNKDICSTLVFLEGRTLVEDLKNLNAF